MKVFSGYGPKAQGVPAPILFIVVSINTTYVVCNIYIDGDGNYNIITHEGTPGCSIRGYNVDSCSCDRAYVFSLRSIQEAIKATSSSPAHNTTRSTQTPTEQTRAPIKICEYTQHRELHIPERSHTRELPPSQHCCALPPPRKYQGEIQRWGGGCENVVRAGESPGYGIARAVRRWG
jgi:hypothetical protein